jgi:hypothetical protein
MPKDQRILSTFLLAESNDDGDGTVSEFLSIEGINIQLE